jgi:membrane-associated phospholipid phosphatase
MNKILPLTVCVIFLFFPEASLADDFVHSVLDDYRLHYSGNKLLQTCLAIGVSGIFANTNTDKSVRKHWQEHIRSDTTDDIAYGFTVLETASHHKSSVPIYLTAMIVGKYSNNHFLNTRVSEWGNRSLRALLLGIPQKILFASATGSGRPEEGGPGWDLFDDNNGVSGHAFYGAVPFLSAAHLSKHHISKYMFYTASIMPGLSRINDDKHYLSQVVLGWSIAFISTYTVLKSNKNKNSDITLTPVSISGDVGIGVCISY